MADSIIPSEVTTRCPSPSSIKSDNEKEGYLDLPERRDALTPGELEALEHYRGTVDDDEELLKLPIHKRLAAYLNQEIAADTLLEVELYCLSFATGLQDAMTLAYFGLFCSKQTGNLIHLALSALGSGHRVQTETNIVTSFCCFLAGAAMFGHLGNLVGKKRRGWLMFVNTWQTAMVLAAAAVRHWAPPNNGLDPNTPNPTTLIIVALLSFASGGQITLALTVGMAEINTTMVTGALVMLSQDKKLFKLNNPGRNRKLLFVVSILMGSFVGAACENLEGASVALLLVGIVKTIVTFMFLCNFGTKKKPGSSETVESNLSLLNILWSD
ncbi:uncharacterized protein J3D65DRAFT_278607 [Phyllosticta citribraziliensis]|uniref:Uncharacterized protein n=1 Tax=Phyllosticta citribraziliensis TaxID=989973 RepID=A0ABR1LXY8_9PEZI